MPVDCIACKSGIKADARQVPEAYILELVHTFRLTYGFSWTF